MALPEEQRNTQWMKVEGLIYALVLVGCPYGADKDKVMTVCFHVPADIDHCNLNATPLYL